MIPKEVLAYLAFFFIVGGGFLLGTSLRKFPKDNSFLSFVWCLLVVFIVLVSSSTLAYLIKY